MLALLVLFVVAALWGAGFLISLEPEDDTIDALREAIVRDANGGHPRCAIRPRSRSGGEQSPNFWFVIRDREGHSVSQGRVPREYAGIGAALDGIGQARLGWNIGDGPRPTARMKWIDTPAGNIQILTGPGGAVSWRRVAPCDLDAVPERRSAHRRADDAGHAYRDAHGGSPNPCRP